MNSAFGPLIRPDGCRLATGVAGAAALFSVVVAGLLLWSSLQLVSPVDAPALRQLQAQLAQKPQDDVLKAQLRDTDLQVRQLYFRNLDRLCTGRYLLLGGLVVFLIALRLAAGRETKLVQPLVRTDLKAAERMAQTVRNVVLSGAVAGILVAVFISLRPLPVIPGIAQAPALAPIGAAKIPPPATVPAAAAGTVPVATSQLIAAEEFQRNWPQFRGPTSSGISTLNELPGVFNGKTGEGLLWKVAVPLPGHNSPIVWGDRVFLSGATADGREIFCFDAGSGKLLWRHPAVNVLGGGREAENVMDDTGFAAPTMATDGRRVFAVFANGDVVAADLTGKRVWDLALGVPENSYGHASSLLVYQNLLIVQFDQGSSGDGKAKLYALDCVTGRTVWEVARECGSSWASPILTEICGPAQVITCANPFVMAYDVAKGAELWRVSCLGGEIAPSPVYADGLVYAVNQGSALVALRPDGRGDVTSTHILWKSEDDLPDICSPLSNGKQTWTLTTGGTLVCYQAKDGKKLYSKELNLEFNASPSLTGGRLLLVDLEGTVLWLDPGPEFKEIARAELGGKCKTSPAFSPGRMFIRTAEHLLAVAMKPAGKDK